MKEVYKKLTAATEYMGRKCVRFENNPLFILLHDVQYPVIVNVRR